MEPVHLPVLVDEVVDALAPGAPGTLLIDATVGEGGHSARLLQQFSRLRVVGLDADAGMIARATVRLAEYGERVTLMHRWFDEFFDGYDLAEAPARVLMDLGISMYHLARSGRGFTFSSDEPLDMRLHAGAPSGAGAAPAPSAADLVNSLGETDLADIIYRYGEERYSRRIAERICRERRSARIDTSGRLAEVVKAAVPKQYRYGRIHPATRTFQALRIAVNNELGRLERAIGLVLDLLPPGGRLAVISFHSLEDRIVKHRFRERAESGAYTLINRKPVTPSEAEIAANPASRSAKLRVVERLDGRAA